MRNFAARVEVLESDRFRVEGGGVPLDLADLGAALEGPIPTDVDGLERLVVAAVRRFAAAVDPERPDRGPVALTCTTTIPRQVGLGGSSAVIIATIRALSARWEVTVPPFELAETALATEVEELGIAAGPLDRVIQAYEQVILMDLAPPRTEASYRVIDPSLVPPLLIAWDPAGGEPSGVTHSDLRQRWERRDEVVVETMKELRDVADRGVAAMEARDTEAFADLVDYNYELRCRVRVPTRADRAMVAVARGLGAAAKLCGSGGAVLVAPRRGLALSAIERAYAAAGFPTCRPDVA